jgi:hypothetical protein
VNQSVAWLFGVLRWGASLLVLCGCRVPVEADVPPSVSRGDSVVFAFGTTEGGEFNSETTRGRVTAVLFVTTFDLASQAEAKRLSQLLRSHRPRINAGAVVLEAPKYATFADVFRTSLELAYPVALADPATLAGAGAFGEVRAVPTLVVLDRDGYETFRKAGLMTGRELEAALAGRVAD